MIIIVRHGETYANVKEGEQPSLTENGREQSKKLRDKLANLPIKNIISSDLDRALDTAKIINEKHSLNINIDAKYREIYRLIVGGPKNKSRPFRKKEDTKRAERVLGSLASLTDNTLIVTHGNLIRYFIAKKLNLPPKKMWNLYLSPCCILVLSKENVKLFQSEDLSEFN